MRNYKYLRDPYRGAKRVGRKDERRRASEVDVAGAGLCATVTKDEGRTYASIRLISFDKQL